MATTNPKKLLHRFRMIAVAEGISFLFLLLVAMPLKYVLKMPLPVKYTGWVHGLLFVLFIYAAVEVFASLKKSIGWLLLALLASVIPFGTFILDKSLKKEETLLP